MTPPAADRIVLGVEGSLSGRRWIDGAGDARAGLALAQAQLVISRSGASSLADITVIGRPSILIPFAAATGDHQTANAQALAESGAALVHPESVLDVESLTRDIRAR